MRHTIAASLLVDRAVATPPACEPLPSKARHAQRFSDFAAALFPSNVGSRNCAVHSGPAGNVFHGTCTAEVTLGRNGTATVEFTQEIQGRHTWVVRVEPGRKAYVVANSGAALVEFID